MILNEIYKINENKNKIIDFYKNNKDRFELNKRKVIDICSNDEDYQYFVKKLIK